MSANASGYVKPGAKDRVLHAVFTACIKLGITMRGMRLLSVRGRKSGEWRTAVVGPLEHEGLLYLVAPRGQTQWVRNLRTAGGGELRLGRRVTTFTAVELRDDEKAPVLRPYLKIWQEDIGVFFNGVTPDAPDDRIRSIAPNHPIFRLTVTS